MKTTEQIRFDYARGFADSEDDIHYRAWDFDRWIAEHDRQVSEHAWVQGWKEGVDVTDRAWNGDRTADVPASRDNNPYRKGHKEETE